MTPDFQVFRDVHKRTANRLRRYARFNRFRIHVSQRRVGSMWFHPDMMNGRIRTTTYRDSRSLGSCLWDKPDFRWNNLP